MCDCILQGLSRCSDDAAGFGFPELEDRLRSRFNASVTPERALSTLLAALYQQVWAPIAAVL
jgi:hypothetical protein